MTRVLVVWADTGLIQDSIYSGYFDAEHARVQLQLAIGSGYSYDRIREVFEADLRSAIYSGHNKVVYGL